MKFKKPELPELKETYYFLLTILCGFYSVAVALLFPTMGKLILEIGDSSFTARAVASFLFFLGVVPISAAVVIGIRYLLGKLQQRSEALAAANPQKQIRKERLFKGSFWYWIYCMMALPILFLMVTLLISVQLFSSTKEAQRYAEEAAKLQAVEDVEKDDFRVLVADTKERESKDARVYPVGSNADKTYIKAYNKRKLELLRGE